MQSVNKIRFGNNNIIMNKDDLPPVQLGQRRYTSSIPSGRISQFSPTEIPAITKRGALSRVGTNSVSIHDVTDPALIDQRLKSLSQASESDMRISLEAEKREKANLKFLRYKFNPGLKQQEGDHIQKGKAQQYGQHGRQNRQKITVNIFYKFKNVLFQDERAPLIYKRLFVQKQNVIG